MKTNDHTQPRTHIYFSDVFGVDAEDLESYGAFNISLVTDLPLFIDHFLLFNSENAEYQQLHKSIIRYMRFLKEASRGHSVQGGLLHQWFSFPEVSQNWLGFSKQGNRGRGLGKRFAATLNQNFGSVFSDFGDETVTLSSHIEKLCLIGDGVGRDMLSDFTANLVKGYLCRFTQEFAGKKLTASQRHSFHVDHVGFNYNTRSWVREQFELPVFRNDYVLLTPKDILTRDEAWINRPDLIVRFQGIADSLPDSALRAQINEYLIRVLPEDRNKKDVKDAIARAIKTFPQLLDHYVREKGDDGDNAVSVARDRVGEVQTLLVDQVQALVHDYLSPYGFYRLGRNSYEEAKYRLLFLKDVIENKGGHRIFYLKGKPIQREEDLQLLYRLTWYASLSDASREVNDGRGPADFKISRGARDKTLVEFKLATNSQLKRNLDRQSPIYEKASDATQPSLKAIVYFSQQQMDRVSGILEDLQLEDSQHIILIDACSDNKPSG